MQSEKEVIRRWVVISSKSEETKGVVLVRYEDGIPRMLQRITYLRMKKSGRNIVLLKEGLHWNELR